MGEDDKPMIYYKVHPMQDNQPLEPIARFERLYKAEEWARANSASYKPLCVIKYTEQILGTYRGDIPYADKITS